MKTFAAALHEGTTAVFYLLLLHDTEGQTQFGWLPHDLKPRAGYVSLEDVDRLLAERRQLGRYRFNSLDLRLFMFGARPDSRLRDVGVVRCEQGETVWTLGDLLVASDHLGCPIQIGRKLPMGSAPLCYILRPG
ncbi:MAG: hypothetical protein RMN51_04875 [Verrucomicrobiota bacterium]|nr:hypothetical protein [Limisphaera sp.]MDW8381426.1 hypothetical protein [Verrucomicrobiota bacterium]